MKKFTLSIFEGHTLKIEKTVEVETKEELQIQKNIMWTESPYRNRGKFWMGVKRIR